MSDIGNHVFKTLSDCNPCQWSWDAEEGEWSDDATCGDANIDGPFNDSQGCNCDGDCDEPPYSGTEDGQIVNMPCGCADPSPPPAPPTLPPPSIPCLSVLGVVGLKPEMVGQLKNIIKGLTQDDVTNRDFPGNIKGLNKQQQAFLRKMKEDVFVFKKSEQAIYEDLMKRANDKVNNFVNTCNTGSTGSPPPSRRGTTTNPKPKPAPAPKPSPRKLPTGGGNGSTFAPRPKPPSIPRKPKLPKFGPVVKKIPGLISKWIPWWDWPIITGPITNPNTTDPNEDTIFGPPIWIPPSPQPAPIPGGPPIWIDNDRGYVIPPGFPVAFPGNFVLPDIESTDPNTGEVLRFPNTPDGWETYDRWRDHYTSNGETDYTQAQSFNYSYSTSDDIGLKVRIANAIDVQTLYGGAVPAWPMHIAAYQPRQTTFLWVKNFFFHTENKEISTAQKPLPRNFLAKSNNGNTILELDSTDNPAKFCTDIEDVTPDEYNKNIINNNLLELYGGNPPLTETTVLVPKE